MEDLLHLVSFVHSAGCLDSANCSNFVCFVTHSVDFLEIVYLVDFPAVRSVGPNHWEL